MIHSQIILFEDTHARSKLFKPLTYTRPLAELLVGAYSALERIKTHAAEETQVIIHVRPELSAVIKKRHPDLKVNELDLARRTIFINARLLVTEYQFNQFMTSEDTLFRWEDHPDEILAFSCGGDIPKNISERISSGEPITNKDVKFTARTLAKAKLFTSLWNMVNSNSVVISSDIKRIAASGTRKFSHDLQSNPRLELSGAKNLYVDDTAQFARKCYLNAKEGPILIEDNVICEPNTVIIGPVVIRSGSLVKAGAKIHPGVTIGPVAKIGGEVEDSIVQGYSNKQHDGYLGHSYIGEWCNLGAGTNTSDLKNDYSNVKVMIEEEEFETKSLFVGLLMGDHSKSAIGTQFNTGTAVGVSSNIFCPGFPPKWIPNFSWCGPDGVEKYRIDKALDVAKIVMARRGKTISEEEITLLKSLS
jgi:UDP-N-acetylglucosamine diphosphorylase/glucosamine-1-phosphate N-acetyltransferase